MLFISSQKFSRDATSRGLWQCALLAIVFFLIRNEEIYIKRRKDTRERRNTREREENKRWMKGLPTKTKTEQKRKHPTLEN